MYYEQQKPFKNHHLKCQWVSINRKYKPNAFTSDREVTENDYFHFRFP